MKHFTIIVLIALIFVGYTAEAKKKQKKKEICTFPVLKTKVKGFSQPLIEIDQETIELDLKKETVTVQLKKVAEFPYNYTPRIEALEINSIGSNNEDVTGIEIYASSNDYNNHEVLLQKLKEFILQPVGSTINVELSFRVYFYTSAKQLAKADIKGLALTDLFIVDQAEFDEVLDFVLQIQEVVKNKDKAKLNSMIVFNYVFPNGSEFIEHESQFMEPEFYFPIDNEFMSKLTRENLKTGNYTLIYDKKKNIDRHFKLYYDSYTDAYCLYFFDGPVEDLYDGLDDDGSAEVIYLKKLNGKFKIVGTEFVI